MTNKDPNRILDDISQELVPQEVNLLPAVLTKIHLKKRYTPKPIYKIALAAFALTLMISLFITPPGGVSALQRIMGFIPGIGIVDQSTPLRVLAEPVTDTRDGFTVTVENAVLDSEHTVITYKVEGPFEISTSEIDGSLSNICFKSAELHLADGTSLRIPNNLPNATWTTGYRVQNSYTAIPGNIDQATLFLPCLHARLAGQAPEDWQIPLSFVPASSDMAVYPVIPSTESAGDTETAATKNKTPYGIELKLDSVIPLQDGQLIQTRWGWMDNTRISGITLYAKDVQIFDARGQEVAFEFSSEAIVPDASNQQSTPYGYKIAVMDASGPSRLVVNTASEVTYNTSTNFTFNPGPNHGSEQIWKLDKDLEIDGYLVHISTITVTEINGKANVTVDMESAAGIVGANIVDEAHAPLAGSTSVDTSGDVPVHYFSSSFTYENGLPEAPITLTVSSITARLTGPWTLEWTPDNSSSAKSNLLNQNQGACVIESDWKDTFYSPQILPSELNGILLVEKNNPAQSTSQLSFARLDGSETELVIESVRSAAASPDGSQIVFLGSDGINIYNPSTDIKEVIPETNSNTGVFSPFWSSDGTQIGFTGTPDSTSPNIYLVGVDGSAPRLLANDEPLKLMQGWLPDGRILYTTLDENGPVLKLIDPQNGENFTLFNVPELTAPIAVSQDGKRLALGWQEQKIGKQILYIFSLNGTQRKPLLEMDSEGVINRLVWSPDGKWLLIDLSWNIPDEPYSKAMINVDTCQIIPLSNLEGSVWSWIP